MSTSQPNLTAEQQWLSALTGAKISAKRENPLKDLDVEAIRTKMTFNIEKMPRGAVDQLKNMVGKNTMTSLDKKGNPMKELDTVGDRGKLKEIDKESLKKAGEALQEIGAIKDKALQEKYADAGYDDKELARMQEALESYQKDGKLPEDGPSEEEIKEFEKLANKIDEEVSDEVFTPLVRQGAMPENLVPDRFSKMKRTFEGASKSYQERLEKYTEENGQSANLIRKLGFSQDVIDKSATLGSAVLGLFPDVPTDVADNIKLAAELLPLASGLVIETTEQIIQKKDPQDIVNSILGSVSGICAKAIPDKDIAAIVTGSITAVIAGGKVARSIKDKDAGATFEALAGAVSASLSTAGDATGNEGLSAAAPAVISMIVTGAKAKAYRDAVEKGDAKEINKALKELLESSVETISSVVEGTIEVEDSDEDQSDELKELVEKGADAIKEATDDDDDADNGEGITDEDKEKLLALKNIIKAQDKIIQNKGTDKKTRREACQKKAQAQVALQENRQMLKKLNEADDPDFMDISEDDLDDSDDDITPPDKLQKLILQLQKDQKIFKLVNTLSSLPLQVAAEFFPPLGAAISFKQFSTEAFIAVKHARALLVWQDNAKNAKWGASPQVHAMLSRVHMADRRATEHSINAALHLTAGVGSIITTVGAHGAPVGVAMTATAKVGLAAAALAKVAIDEAEMERGWRLFQKALKNPGDRRTARESIEANPTLAKYSLAWGALEGGDAFAISALKKCGITQRVLETDGANVQEVQRFLETMFDEDLVILRTVPEKKTWYPSKKPVLTFVSWTAFLGAATTKAKPPLAKGSGGAVSEAFVNYNNADQALKAATKQFDKATEEMEKILKEATAKLPKKSGSSKVNAPKKMSAIQQEAEEQSKIEEARTNLTDSQKAMKEATEALQAACTGYTPLNETDNKEHVEMSEYLEALAALAEVKLRELAGETVALETEDEAEEVEDEVEGVGA